ncbi:MAG TPA: hypothetical protein GXX16_10370 [Epulopiscium sp.]|nr:hypothetical protein [Candidatus Epulonipiscium sp.]
MFFGRRSKEKQRKLAAFLAFLIVIAMILSIILPFVTYAAETEDIIIKGEIGFNNKYKVGGTTPITIEITNNGEDFKGEVQVKILKEEYNNVTDYIVYAKDIELPRGSTKKFDMVVTTSNMQRYFNIELTDGKKSIAKKTIYATAFPPESRFVGVLSEDPQSLKYLKNVGFGEVIGNKLIELDENNFPTDINILNDFETVFINNFDTSKLSKEQINIMNQWVQSGGILILGTGPNSDKVLKGLGSEIASVVNKGITHTTDFTAMEQLGEKTLDSGQPLQIALLDIKNGEDILFSGNLPITTLIHEETGSVIIHHFDLGINPFAQWDGNRYMLTELYIKHIPVFAQTSNTSDSYDYDPYLNPYTLRLFPRQQQTGLVIGVLIIISVYIILVGPILYWILKVKDKREYGWFIIPILAFAFSGGIYLLSYKTIFNAPVGSSIGIVRLNTGETTSSLSISAGFFTPDTGESKITFAENIQPRVSYVDSSWDFRNRVINNGIKTEVISAKIRIGNANELIFYNDQSWAMNTVTASHTVNFAGPINASLTFKDNNLIGTIENHLGFDLETCILVVGDHYYYLDTLKNDDAMYIEKQISSRAKYRYEALDEIFGSVYDINAMNKKWGRELSKEEIHRLIQRREIFVNSNDRYHITTNSFNAQNIYGNNESTIVLYGYSEESLFGDVKINDKEIRNYNQNLFIIPLEIDYSKADQIEIPYGIIKPYITGNLGFSVEEYDQSIYIHSSGSLDLTYSIDPSIKLDEFQIQFMKSSSVDGSYIFNNESGIWEELSILPYEENVQKYRNSEGQIQIRFDVLVDDQKDNRMEIPKLRLKGDKQ